MKIIVFGASGGTGREVIAQGLAQGHTMTAFVRNPGAIRTEDKKLRILKGNVLDQENVAKGIENQDIVISALGNKASDVFWKSNTIISNATRNIIAGMKQNSVRRLLFVASFGVNKEIFLPQKIVIKLFLKNIFADIPLQEELIRKSQLNWTIIHPARLIMGPKTGKYNAGEHLYINFFSKISRADVADYLLKKIDDKGSMHKTYTISY